ncbi:YihY/virulence factor BrkB family protein [Uliginosibacterium sp. H3]|uniref:YihY/virulence factor BrkB family protein n=1 Tax=Uliginosibacterium silvisoli TaxID=3114758 RepID=A0ABU6K8L7_9RHOO|nr:YihY/virulence factor BrkB family protein [Uliginosibacterium sp. H3]
MGEEAVKQEVDVQYPDVTHGAGNDASRTPAQPAGKLATALWVARGCIGGVQGWIADSCASMAAALAFYAAFSLAPMLVVVIAVAGFFFGPDAVEGRLFTEIRGLLGADGANAVQNMVANAWKSGHSGWTALISVGAMFVGASATFAQLNASLNTIWLVRKPTSRAAIVALVKVRLLSMSLVIGIGFLIMVLLILDAALSFAVEWLLGPSSSAQHWVQLAQRGVMLLLLTSAFAVLLKVLPETRVRWKDVWIGAGASAVLFSVGKNLFGMYLARAGTASAFGAAGSLAVLLMWLYFSSSVFLLGAEITAYFGRSKKREEVQADGGGAEAR